MKSKGEKDSDGLMKLVQGVKLQRTDISKRLEAGRTIQLTLDSKAQLLTIISGSEEKKGLTSSQIIQEGRIPRIVITAVPFEQEVCVYVYTVEKPSKGKPPKTTPHGHVARAR